MLELRNVYKEFHHKKKGPVTALRDVSLTVSKGDFVSVVGPSGSGKSTFLFMVGAMMKPSSGRVILMDKDIYDTSAAHRAALRLDKIGFVFQTFNLVPYLTALDNVSLPAILRTKSRSGAVRRATGLLERFGLGGRLDHRFSELSVGERQRVAICRSVINDPEIILADEPTGNLDPAMTREVMSLLKELNDSGHTVMVVTHEEDVAAYAGRVMHLADGVLGNGSLR